MSSGVIILALLGSMMVGVLLAILIDTFYVRRWYDAMQLDRAQLDEETREKLFPYGVENDVALECWDFVDSVRTRREPEISAETTKWTKSLCLAMYESAQAGETVRARDVFEGKLSAYQDPVNEYWDL